MLYFLAICMSQSLYEMQCVKDKREIFLLNINNFYVHLITNSINKHTILTKLTR